MGSRSGRRGWVWQAILIGFGLFGLGSPSALGDDIPLRALQDWQFFNNAAWRALQRGDYNEAELRFREAIKTIEPHQRREQSLLARSYSDLARVLYHQRRYKEAEPLAKWALAVRRRQAKIKDEAIFQNLFVLSKIEVGLEHFTEAEPLLKQALAIEEKALGPQHRDLALTLDELGGVLRDEKKFKESEQVFERAMQIQSKTLPAANTEIAETLEHYALLLEAEDRLTEAEFTKARAREVRAKVEEAARLAAEAARARAADNRPGSNTSLRGFR